MERDKQTHTETDHQDDLGKPRSAEKGRYDEGVPLGSADYEKPGSAQGYGPSRGNQPPKSDARFRSPNQAETHEKGGAHDLDEFGFGGAKSGQAPDHAPDRGEGWTAPEPEDAEHRASPDRRTD